MQFNPWQDNQTMSLGLTSILLLAFAPISDFPSHLPIRLPAFEKAGQN
jgi:hypothetical protein